MLAQGVGFRVYVRAHIMLCPRSSPQLSCPPPVLPTTTCAQVENGKPAPDVFLAAAHAINAAPEECVVVEDAPSGVTGAEAAGMRVVVVPSLVEVSDYPAPDQTRGQGAALECGSAIGLALLGAAQTPATAVLLGVHHLLPVRRSAQPELQLGTASRLRGHANCHVSPAHCLLSEHSAP
jgi:hypothetical protein